MIVSQHLPVNFLMAPFSNVPFPATVPSLLLFLQEVLQFSSRYVDNQKVHAALRLSFIRVMTVRPNWKVMQRGYYRQLFSSLTSSNMVPGVTILMTSQATSPFCQCAGSLQLKAQQLRLLYPFESVVYISLCGMMWNFGHRYLFFFYTGISSCQNQIASFIDAVLHLRKTFTKINRDDRIWLHPLYAVFNSRV